MDYLRVAISTTVEGIELVIGALSAIGIDQVEIIEDEAAIQGYLSELSARWDYTDPSELLVDEEPCLRVYIPLDDGGRHHGIFEDIYLRMEWLRGQNFGVDLGALRVTQDTVREQDWANNWKQYYKPLRIGDTLVVKPSWEEYALHPGDRVIELDPGMAFGTGTHETTALCLMAIEKYTRPGVEVLDIGCGSGILSIAAAKCGARHVTAIDIDPVAVCVARENVKINCVSDEVDCCEADLLKGYAGTAHLLVANIVADPILRLLPAAYQHTLPGGVCIVSGIIDEREEEILEAAGKAGFLIIEVLSRAIWRALVFRRL